MNKTGLITSTAAIAMLVIGAVIFFPDSTPIPESDPIATTPTAMDNAAIVNQYCVVCHNGTLKTGGLELDAYDANDVAAHPEVWERVLRKLRANAMPPTGMPRPDQATFTKFEADLAARLDALAVSDPNPGRTATFSRLNRLQYQNAVRELLEIDMDVSELLPKDDASYGFDNVNLTNLSPTLMERYLAAAQKISRLAVGTPLTNPVSHVELLPATLTQEDRFEGLPFGTRGGTLFSYNFPQDGQYIIDVKLARDRNENLEGLTEPHEMEITIDGRRIDLFEIVPNRSERYATFYYNDQGAGEGLQTATMVTAGAQDVSVTFIRKNSALIESTRQPYEAHFNRDRHPRQQPAVLSVSIAGPYESTGISDTASRQKIFVCQPDDQLSELECANTIVSNLAAKAFRRPITQENIATPLAFFEQVNEEQGFEKGIEMALRAILVSPEFLFRIEQDPADLGSGEIYALSDIELASSLSFFLWSSIPDEELLQLAEQERLSDPAVLEEQVKRMLADPRAETLASNFADQWLYLRNLDAADPNLRLFPDFDDNLRQAMRLETEMLFQHIIQEDRNVMELLSADYTFLNERLARHYDIPNVYGDQFREVILDPDSLRFGLLGHGSVLTVTSYATRTSPVQRGKWVLENVLGIPPPPPPDDVPALPENNSEVKVETMRDRMAQHRANPACAACHQVMDPIGLVMEEFDAIGRIRTVNSDEPEIDASGNLPGSDPLYGVKGLRDALVQNPEAFVGTMSEKLMTYALGRGLDYYDAPAIRKIVKEAAEEDYSFSSIVVSLVNSTPFQMRSTL